MKGAGNFCLATPKQLLPSNSRAHPPSLYLNFNMGRRAKNKQGDPAPIGDRENRPSQKKLGKRKAEDVEVPSKRPTKKARESDVKPVKPSLVKGKSKSEPKSKSDKPKAKTQKRAHFEDEDEGAGSSEGWEDVDSDGDLKAHAKYVLLSCFVAVVLTVAQNTVLWQ